MNSINEFEMYQKNIKKYTVEEFQNNFDELMDRVKKGESFIMTSEYGDCIIMPYNYLSDQNLDDEIVRIHTNHEEGA